MTSEEIGVMSILWTLLVGIVGYSWKRSDKKLDSHDEAVKKLNVHLAENFYTKPEVEQYIRLTQEPLRLALVHNTDATNRLADKMEKFLENR